MKIEIERSDLALVLDGLEYCYEAEGFDIERSSIAKAYKRLKAIIDQEAVESQL